MSSVHRIDVQDVEDDGDSQDAHDKEQRISDELPALLGIQVVILEHLSIVLVSVFSAAVMMLVAATAITAAVVMSVAATAATAATVTTAMVRVVMVVM